jgi:hypothetical protein
MQGTKASHVKATPKKDKILKEKSETLMEQN